MSHHNPYRIAVFSSKNWVINAFKNINAEYNYDITHLETSLDKKTAILAKGYDVICVFVNDIVDADVLMQLHDGGVRLVALRCAGYNNVDINKAQELGIGIVRVPAYSPYAVAEHTVGMILTLSRKYHKAYHRVREANFALDGLMGFDLHKKTVGTIGTGKIGQVFMDIMKGFGCRNIASDKYPDKEVQQKGVEYVDLKTLYQESDIISLHCPLTPDTYHLINEKAISSMKEGVMIINTSRGPLIDSKAVIKGLKSQHIGYLGIDVYEEEQDLFFEDLSDKIIQDDVFVRLQTFPNVLITAHQAFFTKEAVNNITATTFNNIETYLNSGSSKNIVKQN
jgi:D-lactate dehydrogenase